MRSRRWANHKAYDRLPGLLLGLVGKMFQGRRPPKCDVEGSECQLLPGRGDCSAGRREGRGGLWRVNNRGCMGARGLVFLLLTRTPPSTTGSVARRRALSNVNPPRGPLSGVQTPPRYGASAFVQVLSTTSPLLCPHRLKAPPCPRRAPKQREYAPAAHCIANFCFWRTHELCPPTCLHISISKMATQACGRCT